MNIKYKYKKLKQMTEMALIESFMVGIDKRSKPNDFSDSIMCLNSQIWKCL